MPEPNGFLGNGLGTISVGRLPFARAILRRTATYLTNTSDFGIDVSTGACVQGVGHMPGDPHLCRLSAARCLTLARRAKEQEVREAFAAMAMTWKQLAAETEADDSLLRVISEMEFGQPSHALPLALGLIPQAA